MTRHSKALCSALLITTLSVAAAGCSPKEPNNPALTALSETTNQHILPPIKRFAQSAKALDEAVSRFCHNPNNPGEFAATQTTWLDTQVSWSKVRLAVTCTEKTHPSPLEQPLGANTYETKNLAAMRELLFGTNALNRFNVPEQCKKLQRHSNALATNATQLWQNWTQKGENYAGEYLSLGNKGLQLIKMSLTQSLNNIATATLQAPLIDTRGSTLTTMALYELQANQSMFNASLALLANNKWLLSQIEAQYTSINSQLIDLTKTLRPQPNNSSTQKPQTVQAAISADITTLSSLLNKIIIPN